MVVGSETSTHIHVVDDIPVIALTGPVDGGFFLEKTVWSWQVHLENHVLHDGARAKPLTTEVQQQ